MGGGREAEGVHMYAYVCTCTYAPTQTRRREGEGESAVDTMPGAEPDMGFDLITLRS